MRILSGMGSWMILSVLALIWGTSFILIKYGLKVFSPEQVGALRISIAALAFSPVFWRRRRKVDWRKWPFLLVVGLCGSFIPALLFALAQTRINSTMAGILNSLTPLFTLIIGILFFKRPFELRKALGVSVGLLGAVLLIAAGSRLGLGRDAWYGALVVIATMCYATSGNTVGAHLNKMNVLTISAVSYGLVGIPALLLLLSTGFVEVMQTSEGAWVALGYISILSLAGTFFASLLFFHLIQRTDAVFGSSIAYLIPLVALAWGVFDEEHIRWWHFAGMGLILGGVYLTRGRKQHRPTLAQAEIAMTAVRETSQHT